MELAELFRQQTLGKAEDQTVLQGVLIRQGGNDWAKIDGQTRLWGPVVGASAIPHGTECVFVIDQNNKPYVVWPQIASGGTGDDANYVHTQGSPSATWVVTHNLGKLAAVDVVDTGDTVVIPTVHYDDLNQVTLLFGSPTSGKAFVN